MIVFLVPIYNSVDIFNIWSEAIYKLTPPPDKVIFCENNSTDDTLEKLTQFKLPHEIIRMWVKDDAAKGGKGNEYNVIAHVRQLLLTRARQINPDFAIFLDDDVVPIDVNMITRLTLTSKFLGGVVGGSYLRRFPRGVFISAKWATPHKGWWRLHRFPPIPYREIEEPYVVGGGCLCLNRKIVQDRKVNFFPRYRATCAEDFSYCLWARDAGYKIHLDQTVGLRHIKTKRNVNTDRPWTVEFYDGKKKRLIDFSF